MQSTRGMDARRGFIARQVWEGTISLVGHAARGRPQRWPCLRPRQWRPQPALHVAEICIPAAQKTTRAMSGKITLHDLADGRRAVNCASSWASMLT